MSERDVTPGSAGNSSSNVSWSLRLTAAWSWRILVILGLIAAVIVILTPIRTAVIATLLALLVAVLLTPFVAWLERKLKMGRTLAATIGFLLGILIIVGLFSLALKQLVVNMGPLVEQTLQGINELLNWIKQGPLGNANVEISEFISDLQDDVLGFLKANSSLIATEALNLASSAVSMVAAGIVVFFALFFFLKDGRGMWIWFVRMLPEPARNPVNEAGIRGWVTLSSYVRTQVQVAAIDAVGIGLGAYFLGVPLAIPITVLVFFFAFIPIVGAFASGAIAVFIALMNNGLSNALLMLLVVLLVQQIESNFLQPILMSHAVSLHPLAVVLVVTVGSMVAGVPGALFSVPLLAFVNSVTLYLHGHDPMPSLATDLNRPGGPPGSLDKQIARSYGSAGIKEDKEGSLEASVKRSQGHTG